jgi:putative ABC transport system permease protein
MPWLRRSQRDFEDEIASHLEIETDRLIAEGVSPDKARFVARKKFGNVGAVQERYHDGSRLVWLEQLFADIRYAARTLRKSPMFATLAIITLALGIGANTAVFSVVNGVLLSRLPYREPDRLVQLWESLPNVPKIMISYPDFLDWKARNRTFDDVALYMPFGGKVNSSGDLPKELHVGSVTANLFTLLGVRPLIGRGLTPDDATPGASAVALLGAGYWRTEFAGKPDVVGKTISLDGESYKIIGVMPSLPSIRPLEVWVPMRPDLDSASYNRGNHPGLMGVGRLKAGVTLAQMNADLARISAEIVAEHPTEAGGIGAGGEFLGEGLVRNIKPALKVLSWAVVVLLLIACVNVANLVLSRSTSRRKEVALRRALGAGESRVLRLLLIENLLLAVTGGVLGIGLAYAGVRGLVSLRPTGVPRLGNIHVDVSVMLFAAAVSIVTGLVFGLLPARHAARTDLNNSLKEGGRAGSASGGALRLRSVLMTLEVAMALVLLAGAGLLTRSFAKLVHVDPGVDPTGVMTGGIGFPSKRYPTEESQRLGMNDILRRVQSVPGVTSAALTTGLPLSGNIQNKITFEGHPRPKGQEPLIQISLITPDYFRTVGIHVLMGRGFGPTDVKGGAPVVWIDETLAKQYFPGENPIGKWLVHGGVDSQEPKHTVVGVVNTTHDSGLDDAATGIVYYSFDQNPQSWTNLVLKTALPFERVMPAVRREIAGFDKLLPLGHEQSLNALIAASVGQEKFVLSVLGVFAIVALVLAAIGVYGVIAYYVAQRSHEIGIRMALGAARSSIAGLVSRRVLTTTGIGVVAGLIVAVLGSGIMKKLLYEIQPVDWPTYTGSAVVLIAVAMLAALVPVTRATRINPVETMKAD